MACPLGEYQFLVIQRNCVDIFSLQKENTLLVRGFTLVQWKKRCLKIPVLPERKSPRSVIPINKINTVLTVANSEKIAALCDWIAKNCDRTIGWEHLSKQSGLSHSDLITLFKIHKHQTPMAYIKNVREQTKRLLPRYPQANLFNTDWPLNL